MRAVRVWCWWEGVVERREAKRRVSRGVRAPICWLLVLGEVDRVGREGGERGSRTYKRVFLLDEAGDGAEGGQ
jgi:hypothetical protein